MDVHHSIAQALAKAMEGAYRLGAYTAQTTIQKLIEKINVEEVGKYSEVDSSIIRVIEYHFLDIMNMCEYESSSDLDNCINAVKEFFYEK